MADSRRSCARANVGACCEREQRLALRVVAAAELEQRLGQRRCAPRRDWPGPAPAPPGTRSARRRCRPSRAAGGRAGRARRRRTDRGRRPAAARSLHRRSPSRPAARARQAPGGRRCSCDRVRAARAARGARGVRRPALGDPREQRARARVARAPAAPASPRARAAPGRRVESPAFIERLAERRAG